MAKIINTIRNNKPPFLDPVWSDILNDQTEYSTPSTFWIDNPAILFQSAEIIPHDAMNNAERLNAMTRIVIIISILMFLYNFPFWWLFLGLSIIFIIIYWFFMQEREKTYKRKEFLRTPRNPIIQPINPEPKLNIISYI